MGWLSSLESAGRKLEDDFRSQDSEKPRANTWNDAMAHARMIALGSDTAPPPSFAGASAITVVNRDFGTFDTAAEGGKPDGSISEQDLQAVSQNKLAETGGKPRQATVADQTAASYLLTHPEVLDALETADNGGMPGGKISSNDVAVFTRRENDSDGLDGPGAIQVLKSDFGTFDNAAEGGKTDGFVSDNDLRAVSNGKDSGATQQDRAAADYLLTHPLEFRALDTAAEGDTPDGKISSNDVTVFTKEEGDALDEPAAIQVLNKDFGKFNGGDANGFISVQDLHAVSNDPGANQQDRDAADYLLTHPAALDALDTAAEGGSPDGQISRNDLTDFTVNRGDAPTLQTLPLDISTPPTAPGQKPDQTPNQNPTILHIQANAPAGANWGNKTNRAGIVSVYVDGHYVSDATILSENPEGVDVNLGVLSNGHHTITLEDTTAVGTGSQGKVTNVQASTRQLSVAPPKDPKNKQEVVEYHQALAAAFAPVVHYDNNSQAGNNVPLLNGAQVTDNPDGSVTINYSVLFSNEDGGYGRDPANAAQVWGRNTDYQNVYSVTVKQTGQDRTWQPVKFTPHPDLDGSQFQRGATGQPDVVVHTSDNQYDWASNQPARAQNRAFSAAPSVTTAPNQTATWNSVNLMNQHAWIYQVETEELRREKGPGLFGTGLLAHGNKLDDVNPDSRLYLNLPNGTNDGPTFQRVTRIQVTMKDGTLVTVGTYGKGTIFGIGGNRLAKNNNVSMELPINPATGNGYLTSDVASVRVEGLPAGTPVQAQGLDPTTGLPYAVQVANGGPEPTLQNP